MEEFSKPKTDTQRNRSTIFVSGTVVAILAAAIGAQMWRATNSKAAEQYSGNNKTQISADLLSEPVGRVNGQPITYEELAAECIERYGAEVLDSVINRRVIQQACAKVGVQVSDAEVNTEVTRISKKFGLPVNQWEKMLQAERGLTPLQYRRDVIWPMLALKKLAGASFQPTREQMQKAYADNYGPRVKARMIVLDNPRRAQQIWEQLKRNPDEFENFARDYSVEPNSRALGGAIPPIRQHSGAHENIRRAAYKLKTPGEISGILEVGVRSYAILQFEGRTEPIEHDPKDVQAQLYEDLKERELQETIAKTFDKLREQSRIDNLLNGESTAPAAPGETGLPGDIQEALGQ